jgi:uncharacterized membrane protein YphA (DoxX/SURF4 family)
MKKISNQIAVFFGALLGMLPIKSYAHVKWFAEENITYHKPYSFLDQNILIITLVAILIIIIGFILERKIKIPEKFQKYISKIAPIVISCSTIFFGLALIFFSFYGFIFAPNLIEFDLFFKLMLGLQLIAGIMILAGFYEKIGGLLVIILFFLSILKFGFIEMLDALEILAFSIYIFIVGRPKWKLLESNYFNKITHKIHSAGYSILRIGTGMNLIVLGFTEKILSPNLAQNFLNQYHWNFMPNLGFINYTDYYFIFSAGIVEALFGIFLVLGLVTRITTFVLAIFLIITLVLLGPTELIGHLPHFSIAFIFLVLGKGAQLKFKK